jgi:hypothetical protein
MTRREVKASAPTALRNSWWCRSLWADARWIHSWEVPGTSPHQITFGHRRYWRRRMSDLARTLKQRYGVGVEELA